jgi:hypothetical protein
MHAANFVRDITPNAVSNSQFTPWMTSNEAIHFVHLVVEDKECFTALDPVLERLRCDERRLVASRHYLRYRRHCNGMKKEMLKNKNPRKEKVRGDVFSNSALAPSVIRSPIGILNSALAILRLIFLRFPFFFLPVLHFYFSIDITIALRTTTNDERRHKTDDY